MEDLEWSTKNERQQRREKAVLELQMSGRIVQGIVLLV